MSHSMSHKDHIKNILREVRKGEPNPGEGMDVYLDRKVEQVLGYVEEVPVTKDTKSKKASDLKE